MENASRSRYSRRQFVKTSTAIAAGIATAPYIGCSTNKVPKLMKRHFGNMEFDVTSIGLGGQASIQWTPPDVNPVKIILKAFNKGINYFDTSNLYGPSQLNFGKAFRELAMIPGMAGYNETLRKSIFLTSKTHLRWAKGGDEREGVRNRTNGENEKHTIDDVKRSLSQMFGDGKGNYPRGAYLDLVLIHNLNTTAEVDVLYTGYQQPDEKDEHIGALAALVDYRDGTNFTGLNPAEEKLIKHIGFSGHYSAAVMMDMIRRDEKNILDAMLVAINANDRLNFNMQHNVMPVANAKNMGIIGMKTFADGAMYTKEATWSREPKHVVRTVGSEKLPSRPLIEYSLTTPGVSTAIIGIGEISEDPGRCQLTQNIAAAQIAPKELSGGDRESIEELANRAKEGKTNYFQVSEGGLSAVTAPAAERKGKNEVQLTWNTAYAGSNPIKQYEIYRGSELLGRVKHQPQTDSKPFAYVDKRAGETPSAYKVVTVDSERNRADSILMQA